MQKDCDLSASFCNLQNMKFRLLVNCIMRMEFGRFYLCNNLKYRNVSFKNAVTLAQTAHCTNLQIRSSIYLVSRVCFNCSRLGLICFSNQYFCSALFKKNIGLYVKRNAHFGETVRNFSFIR